MINWYWKDGTLATTHDMDDEHNQGLYDDMRKIEEKLQDPKYKIVKQETIPNGKWVSTVWLGLDQRLGFEVESDKPIIFETMVFPKKGDFSDLDCERYSTEEEAIAGHKEMVKKWSEL